MSQVLPRSSPSAQGVDPGALLRLVDALDSSGHEPHGLMVMRGGHVIAEGWWAPYRRDTPHLLYSLSKAVTSLAVGTLLDDGVIGLDDPILDHLDPDRRIGADERFEAITIRHAMTMTTGHETDLILPMFVWILENPDGDWLEGFLTFPPERPPGEIFTYNQFATYALARIVAAKTGRRLLDVARDRILDHLDPVGAEAARWLDPGGYDLGFSGLHVRLETIAALGELTLRKGRWGGQQLISPERVEAATTLQVRNDGEFRSPGDPNPEPDWNSGYGHQFWICRHGYRGDGALGQFSIVWPDEDLVIATTASAPDMQGLLDLIEEHLSGAVGVDVDQAAAADTEALLVERLAGLELAPVGRADETIPVGAYARPTPGGDVGSVAGIELRQDGERCFLRVDHAAGPFDLEVGAGRWIDGDWPAHRGRPGQPVAVSGGTDAAGVFRADVVFIQTPHRMHVALDPTDASANLAWNQFPLHGSDPADFVPG